MTKIQEIWFIYKNKIIMSIILGITSIAFFIAIYFFNIGNASADSIVLDNNVSLSSEKEEAAYDTIKVDIKGEIKKPGVYEIKAGSRIQDLVTLAGGLTSNADTSVINLSKKLLDEMVIIIYSKNDIKNFSQTVEKQNNNNEKCKNSDIIYNDGCITQESKKSQATNSLININTASFDELLSISGIGESKVKAIIEYRTTNGPFKNISDIKNVSGIGEALFEKIKSNITV